MVHQNKAGRQESAPALARLLADSSLSRAALAACGFPVALVDAGGTGKPITYVNSAFSEFFGLRGDEALGRPVITLLFPQDQNASELFVKAPIRTAMRARRRDGTTAHVELSVGMVHGTDGRLTHWVLAFADRDELERMREELRLLKSLAAAP